MLYLCGCPAEVSLIRKVGRRHPTSAPVTSSERDSMFPKLHKRTDGVGKMEVKGAEKVALVRPWLYNLWMTASVVLCVRKKEALCGYGVGQLL